MTSPLAHPIVEALRANGVDLAVMGRAWARATPLVVLVPAFGLRALPAPMRVTLALGLAAVIYPALAVDASTGATITSTVLALEVLRGMPLALATAVPLWAAVMAGGLVDQLRGSSAEGASFVVVDGRPSPIAVLYGLGASFAFFAMGGPARAVSALVTAPLASPWRGAAITISNGIGLSIALAAPILAASLVLEITTALVARAAAPAHVDALLAPLKAIALLFVVALGLSRVVALFP